MTGHRFILVLLFGFVLIYLPVRLWSVVDRPETFGIVQMVAILICAVGGTSALWCASTFAVIGRGTPAPFAAPSRLVIRGPYRFLRNPMYVGVGVLFTGAAIFYQSRVLLAYVALFCIASHLFVVHYEEPTLRRHFGSEYSAYCRRVRRWWPRW